MQSSLDEVDAELTDHFSGGARRHPASAIDFTPHAFLAAVTVQAALVELLDKLLTTSCSRRPRATPGRSASAPTRRQGPRTRSAPAPSTASSRSCSRGSTPTSARSRAPTTRALPHAHITSMNVQAQLQEIVADLESTLPWVSVNEEAMKCFATALLHDAVAPHRQARTRGRMLTF